ncbi:peptidylprolyl isomerase [Ekhidna sp. To15]|uniref:peptidylprolyl isomerase n=1 Tax=Ekhidna sp. To15 TaxID=3395267 RepID=UPI003F524A70
MKYLTILSLAFLIACTSGTNEADSETKPERTNVKLTTTKGEIVLQLYNETPLHRDNFIKIVEDGVLDSLLFHRVIETFMIQGGDINSKTAQPGDTLGNGDLPYEVPAEITPKLFHKKGVLAAARGGHPDRVSSSTQFYIVQGKVFNDSLLNSAETRINGWLAEYYIKHDSAYSQDLDSLMVAIDAEDWPTVSRINNRFYELAKDYESFEQYEIPAEHREVYKTLGGTPHLDQNYTVFGEVVAGLTVVDSIAAVSTDGLNRPIEDVRILSASVVEL